MDSRRLQQFSVLARTGSFTRTARELQLTQSGISHSMKALETETGCRLLDRLGKKVMLTPAGQHLLQHAQNILAEMEAAQDTLAQWGRVGRSRLRLGASASACQYLIPPVLREFKPRFPDHAITLEPGNPSELAEALMHRRIDLALTLEGEREPNLEFHPLFTDELCFLVGPLHSWAKARPVKPEEIPRQSYILYSKRSLTFRLLEDYFRREKVTLNTVIELGSVEAIKELVKLGLGVGILASWVARREIDDGSMIALPLGRRKLTRRWGILHWRGKRLNLAEETFIGLCKSASALLG